MTVGSYVNVPEVGLCPLGLEKVGDDGGSALTTMTTGDDFCGSVSKSWCTRVVKEPGGRWLSQSV